MSSALNVAAAAQTVLARRLDSVANNLANASTAGFRADGVRFESTLSRTAGANVAFPSAGSDYISTASGPVVRTGGPLDLAVRGQGWFALMSPDGPVYTRDGRFQLTPGGQLQSVNGYPVLDASEAPLLLDPNAGDVSVAGDGALTQRGRQIGAVGLFAIEPAVALARYDNSSVRPAEPAAPILDFTTNGITQGFVEQSNVDPIRELTRLIEIQRAFDNITSSMELTSATQQDAIRALGSPT